MPTPTPPSEDLRTVEIVIDEAWRVGPAPTGAVFGGLIAAEAVRAARATLDAPAAVPLSVSISYHRPVLPGRVALGVRVIRRGRRVATVSLVVSPGHRPAATAIVVLGLGAGPAALPFRRPGDLPPPAQPAAGDLSAIIDWRARPDPWSAPAGEPLAAWIRPRRNWWTDADGLDAAWFAVAADLIGPALAPAAFRVATVSLDLRVHATTGSEWLQQRVTASSDGEVAVATVELSDPAGVVVATASQHAILVPTGAEDVPASVTAFGWGIPDSSIHARMIGLS